MSTSLPSGEPFKPKPRAYSLLEMDMLVGVWDVNSATPLDIVNTKSLASIAPEPLPVLNAFSLRVTVTVLLSSAKIVFVMDGPLLSFKFEVPLV